MACSSPLTSLEAYNSKLGKEHQNQAKERMNTNKRLAFFKIHNKEYNDLMVRQGSTENRGQYIQFHAVSFNFGNKLHLIGIHLVQFVCFAP